LDLQFVVETAAKAGRKFEDDAVARIRLFLPMFVLSIKQYLYQHETLQTDQDGLFRNVSTAEMKGSIRRIQWYHMCLADEYTCSCLSDCRYQHFAIETTRCLYKYLGRSHTYQSTYTRWHWHKVEGLCVHTYLHHSLRLCYRSLFSE